MHIQPIPAPTVHHIFIQSHLIYYIQSRFSFLQSSFSYSVCDTMGEDIVPKVLSCSKCKNIYKMFRNKLNYKSRKRQIQKEKNTEDKKEYCTKSTSMESATRITFFLDFYALFEAQVSFLLMTEES